MKQPFWVPVLARGWRVLARALAAWLLHAAPHRPAPPLSLEDARAQGDGGLLIVHARYMLDLAKTAGEGPEEEALRLQATLGLVPSTDDSPPLPTPPPLAEVEGDASAIKPTPSVTPSTTLTSVDGEVAGGSSAGPVHSSGPVRPVPGAASTGASTARSPVSRRSTEISSTGISSTSTATEAAGDASAVTSAAGLSMLALSGEDAKEYTYYDDPRLKRPPEHSPLEAFSLHAMEKRRRALANTKYKIKSC
jgi:hypothetical protein